MAGNRLFGLGLSALCTGLTNNTVLRKLDVSDNKIDQVLNITMSILCADICLIFVISTHN